MNWIYPTQLSIELNKEIKPIYILFGNNLSLIKDSQENIIRNAKKLNFHEQFNFELDLNFNWNKIFNLCKTFNLFIVKQILLLNFSSNYSITDFNKKISLLCSFKNKNIIFIFCIHKPMQIKKNDILLLYPFVKKLGTFVICDNLSQVQLITWINYQAKKMDLIIEHLTCQLLCYYYEDNLILLQQVLKNLSIIYPDRNLSFKRVKQVVDDFAYFNINHWIEAILIGRYKQAFRIFQQLIYMNNVSLDMLLRKIQNEILIIVKIKYNFIQKISLYTLFNKYKIYEKYHQILLSKAIRRLNMHKLHRVLELLVQIELQYNKNYNNIFPSHFELLMIILCFD